MNEYAKLDGNGKKTVLPLIEGTAGERQIANGRSLPVVTPKTGRVSSILTKQTLEPASPFWRTQ